MAAGEALSTREIAAYCGVSPVTVWKWIERGELGADDFMHKPLDLDRLRTIVRRLLEV